jgi:hypothetical protein
MTIIELRAHIKIRLGAPVINIELDDAQMDIYIVDAVDKFIEVHYDGLDDGYQFLTLIRDQQVYVLDDNIHSVLDVMSVSDSLLNDEPLLINPYLVGNTYGGASNILDLEMFRQSVSVWESYLETSKMYQFNSTTHQLKILEIPESNITVALRVHAAPLSNEMIYNNSWVKKFSTALCKKAWAGNLKKFDGATLPGGVSLNWSEILNEAKEEIESLETELYERYQEPVDFRFA